MKITGSSGDRERIAIFVPNGMDMEEFIKKMREAYPVSDGALQLFLRHTERVTLPKGHLLIRDGVVEKYSYFIVRGFARGFLYRDGKDATIWFATAGMSLLSMNAYLFRSSGLGKIDLEGRQTTYLRSLKDGRLGVFLGEMLAVEHVGGHPVVGFSQTLQQLKLSVSDRGNSTDSVFLSRVRTAREDDNPVLFFYSNHPFE